MNEDPSPSTILERALDIADPQARAAWLDEACGEDEALRSEIESLLAAHREADADFMDTLVDSPWQEAPGEKAGDVIGRYRLLEQIGQGGFGTVYMAEQTRPVKRRVALKVIKAGMDTREVIARFEAERQALAMMDHPFIAKVYDAGTTDGGRPYFVMELVEGVPITRHCNDHDLDTKARIELFIDVCAAVQHAHQKGVIHRDLKPGNILVSPQDPEPAVKVIDFGIAKAISMEVTEKTILTQLGRMIGTPQYMSPEQADLRALDVDTRSDIYSLGVILYELLTGTTPLDGEQLRSAAYGEVQRMIREETPPKPSTKLSASLARSDSSNLPRPRISPRGLRGGLDWIVMKALEKDPGRRYESAGAMAEDLHRFLQHKPIDARPPSRTYAALQFARRHRGPVLAGAGLLLALVLGAAGTSIGMKRALDAKEEVVRKNEELDEQRLVLVDYKERLSGLLESNQRMLGQIGRMGISETQLPEEFEALRRDNQALLDKVRNEVANQRRYTEEIESLQRAKAQFEELAESRSSENAGLKAENERLLAKLAELQTALSVASRRPAGKYTGAITFAYPAAERRGLRSVRVLDFGAGGETVAFTSVAHQLDAAGTPTGVVNRSSVELVGAWEGSVFHSAEQRVISTDFAAWSPEEIRLSYSSRTNRIDWISTFGYAGNTVVGKGVLTPVSE